MVMMDFIVVSKIVVMGNVDAAEASVKLYRRHRIQLSLSIS